MRWRDLIKLPNFKVIKPVEKEKKGGSKSKKNWHGYGLCWGKPRRRKA